MGQRRLWAITITAVICVLVLAGAAAYLTRDWMSAAALGLAALALIAVFWRRAVDIADRRLLAAELSALHDEADAARQTAEATRVALSEVIEIVDEVASSHGKETPAWPALDTISARLDSLEHRLDTLPAKAPEPAPPPPDPEPLASPPAREPEKPLARSLSDVTAQLVLAVDQAALVQAIQARSTVLQRAASKGAGLALRDVRDWNFDPAALLQAGIRFVSSPIDAIEARIAELDGASEFIAPFRKAGIAVIATGVDDIARARAAGALFAAGEGLGKQGSTGA